RRHYDHFRTQSFDDSAGHVQSVERLGELDQPGEAVAVGRTFAVPGVPERRAVRNLLDEETVAVLSEAVDQTRERQMCGPQQDGLLPAPPGPPPRPRS